MADEKTTRCTTCGGEFSDAEIEGASACPACGSRGVPMAIANDKDIRINTHELRILTIWAHNWAEQCDRQEGNSNCVKALGGILNRLRVQLPGVRFSVIDEAQGLADHLGSEVKAHADGETSTYKPRKPN